MKKLLYTILFIFCIVATSQVTAQDGKPTKAQTIAFIQDYFKNAKTFHTINSDFPQAVHHLIVNQELQFIEDSSKIVFYRESIITIVLDRAKLQGDIINEKEKYIIELSEIDNIRREGRLLHIKAAPDYTIEKYTVKGNKDTDLNTLKLPAKPEYMGEISFWILSSKEEDNEKIVKAFNHLRKLCGAPEPINFDD